MDEAESRSSGPGQSVLMTAEGGSPTLKIVGLIGVS